MAVDSTSERVMLEKKRNDELIQIASTLGLTPSTRTKKAELVDMIVSHGGTGAPSKVSNRANGTRSTDHGGDTSKMQDNQGSQKTTSLGSPVDQNGDRSTKRLVRSQPSMTEEMAASEKAPTWDAQAPKVLVSPMVRFEPTAILPPIVVEVPAVSTNTSTDGTSTRSDSRSESNDTSNSRRRNRQGQAPAQSRSSQPSDDTHRQENGRSESSRSDESSERGFERDMSDQSRRRDKKRGRTNQRGDIRENDPRNTVDLSNVELTDFSGLLDLRDEGFGFIRSNGYLPSPKDIYVSVNVVRRHMLRRGDVLDGGARNAVGSEKYPALVRLDKVNGLDPEAAKLRPKFEDLTPLFPDEQLRLETPTQSANVTARIIDLVSPIGKGQRGLIVSPPKAGKTTVMKEIARCIELNNPEVYLLILLVDERPEEVTDIRRSVKGEVASSTFDRPSEEHVAVAELAIEKAKRMVEMGRDVVVILDGITRLTRAYNLALPPTGRIMSGGVDSGAIYPPKKFFGAARNVEEGGSLTILATALVETGSRMDEVIFEEFKGTGNMELRLDRRLAERRLYPAIDVNSSSTRHEELLFPRDQLNQVWKLRRVLTALSAEGSSAPGLELLIDKIRQTKSNADFLAEIAKSPGM